jgi:TusA-related sulfurtransferase
MSGESLDRAVSLSRSGKKLAARNILEAILKADPRTDTAWLWYADTFPDTASRIRILEKCLEYNPEFQIAKKWLITFRAEEEAKQSNPADQELPDFQPAPHEQEQELPPDDQASPSQPAAGYDELLDCSGLPCPLPVIRAKKAIDPLQPGQVLKLIATDPGSVADMKAWTNTTGHILLEQAQEDGKFIYFIRHK